MYGLAGPFTDKYFRYLVSWLLFGLFGTIYLSQWGVIYGLFSLVAALTLSLGIDFIISIIVKWKVKAIVKEEPTLIVDAVRHSLERRGYLVVTKNYCLFVPLFAKVKTILELENVVRYQFDGRMVELIAKFPNRYRTFAFSIISSKKLSDELEKRTEQSVPYQFESRKVQS
ncbi:hypothetical protein LGQ02_20370 [Bacillus shivajii]|uniref:hypothetical protein n=1 Tax=Bacillus shivajii TaxID=1983719 RepID=UPI001CF9C27A|nr:hypothetical protein [Bacillus shivajii]UCZ53101.1 hypothetical protein LGQ02_20370 [Bacillus shivajii]